MATPTDRRVINAVAILSGLRLGEIAGLRWRHLTDATPLDQLIVAHSYSGPTKTDVPRQVPVHPLPVLQLIPTWIDDYNENQPLKGLRMLSPRQFRRLHNH